jgi:hypothetical protein
MRRRIRGKNLKKKNHLITKEEATKETKLCLPLLPPDQAFSDTVSLITMNNVESILVTCMSIPLTDPQHPLSFPHHPQKKKMVASFFHGNKLD